VIVYQIIHACQAEKSDHEEQEGTQENGFVPPGGIQIKTALTPANRDESGLMRY
jgi:hypothetical protein